MEKLKEWIGRIWAGIVAVLSLAIGIGWIGYRARRAAEVEAANDAKEKADKDRIEGLHGNEEHRKELLR